MVTTRLWLPCYFCMGRHKIHISLLMFSKVVRSVLTEHHLLPAGVVRVHCCSLSKCEPAVPLHPVLALVEFKLSTCTLCWQSKHFSYLTTSLHRMGRCHANVKYPSHDILLQSLLETENSLYGNRPSAPSGRGGPPAVSPGSWENLLTQPYTRHWQMHTTSSP